MTDVAPARTRKDAARNRAQLMNTAADLFAQHGLEVTLKDVAQGAGVGVGTVYRHFPTKDALVEALFAEHLDREVERARAMAREDDAWVALVNYIEATMLVQASNSGLRALLCPAGSMHETVRECKGVVDPLVEQMVEAAHRQGTLRPDCTARDIALLQVALVGIMDATPGQSHSYRRHLQMFLDGLRAR